MRRPTTGSAVPFQQRGSPAKARRKHQAIVVRPHGSSVLIAPGSEHVETRSAVIKLVAFFFHRDFQPRFLRLDHDWQKFALGMIDLIQRSRGWKFAMIAGMPPR